MNKLKPVKPWRDAMLFVIACEGEETEIEYFEGLGEKFQNNPRIRIEIVEREKNSKSKSAPEYVIQTLDKRKKSITLQKTKVEFWAIIDFDSWGVEKLAQIATLSKQKNYNLAVSNPCFEIWILFHYTDLSGIGNKLNKKVLKTEIRKYNNTYNPTLLKNSEFFPLFETAIENAKALDTNPSDRWPHNYGSDVYKLAECILVK